MDNKDIDTLLQAGWWVSVTPVMSDGKWAWTCGIYKKGKKTGNWITNNCKTWPSPNEAYDWAFNNLEPIINGK